MSVRNSLHSLVSQSLSPFDLPLSRTGRYLSMMFLFDTSLVVAPLSFVCVSVGKLSVIFEIIFDDDDVYFFSRIFPQ